VTATLSEPENWRDAVLARLRALPPPAIPSEGGVRSPRLGRVRGEPDNPVAAQRLGWAYVAGYSPPEPASPSLAELLASDPAIVAMFRREPALALELVGLRSDDLDVVGLRLSSAPHVIAVTDKREFAFDARIDATETVPLADDLDATNLSSGVLVVRLHESTTWTAAGASATVEVYNISRDPDDPSIKFAEGSPIASVTIPFNATAPVLYVEDLATPIAAHLRVVLVWHQGIRASTAAERVVIAADLIARP
jgi:hypothetical protein